MMRRMFWGDHRTSLFFIVVELIMKEKVFVRGFMISEKIFFKKKISLSSSSMKEERGESGDKTSTFTFFENLKIFENTDKRESN